MKDERPSKPLVPDYIEYRTLTIKAFILGTLLSMVLAASNAYIGLLVGITVSASIPAAAASLGVFRLFRKTNILESNLVQTSASAGESIVAGMIFTVPALVMLSVWPGYEFGPMVAIAVLGGLLGVAFTIPLRRALIVDAKLAFPEGVATAEVLKSGGISRGDDDSEKLEEPFEAKQGFNLLLKSSAIGGLYKLLESGLHVIASSLSFTKATGGLLFTGSIALSPALLAIGYIVRLNIASLVFLGGILGTLIGVPLNAAINMDRLLESIGYAAGTSLSVLDADAWKSLATASWQDCRRVGVGAMLVGGFWSLIILIKPVWRGVISSLNAYKIERSQGTRILRTERDTPMPYIFAYAAATTIPVFLVFYWAMGELENALVLSLLMTFLVMVFGFIFSAVAGYIAGIVGSSNSPISGVTLATLVVSSLLVLQLFGNSGPMAIAGPMIVLYLAAFICASASIAGDNMQDLQCGYLIGATPWKQQLFQVVGVVAAAMVIPGVLELLDNAYGIGRPVREGVQFLAAPQASLMRDISTGIFGATLNWAYIIIGCVLGVILIIIDEIQRIRGSSIRFPILAVAVGIYLPMGLSVPMFLGGLLAYIAGRRASKEPKIKERQKNQGLLLASGLITGEALMGIGIAVALVLFPEILPKPYSLGALLGVLAMIFVSIYLVHRTNHVEKED